MMNYFSAAGAIMQHAREGYIISPSGGVEVRMVYMSFHVFSSIEFMGILSAIKSL